MNSDSSDSSQEHGRIRLQKVLAQAGLGSRRKCEELIVSGRVEVNGSLVTELGSRMNPATDALRVDGKRIPTTTGLVVLMLNKPRGVHTTMSDEHGRPCVGDYAPPGTRVFHVGRLDAETEGLLVLTNDGDLANRISHPSHGMTKTYLADVAGEVRPETVKQVRDGVDLEDGPVAVDSFRVIQHSGGRTLVEVVLHEGRNRIVRRLLDAVGHPVERLVRTRLGPLSLGRLKPGTVRELSQSELSALYTEAGL